MTRPVVLLTAILLISSVVRSDETPTAATPPASAGALSEEPLLLLEDEPMVAQTGEGPVADNSRCQVCHLNLFTEDLAAKHAKANVGCAKCHGESDAHIADESWASGGNGTPPEIMYPKSKIARGCMECHKAEQVFVKAEKHKPDAWAIACEEKLCTECHGQHRLLTRKCRWK